MKCLLCHEAFYPPFTFRLLLTLDQEDTVCPRCRQRFSLIEEPICERCGRPYCTGLCDDCQRWRDIGDVLEKNRSVYQYNEWMQDVFSRFKFRGDYAVVEAFRTPFTAAFFHHFPRDVLIVPIPLSEPRLLDRGFNQAEALASLLPLPMQRALERLDHAKQSQKQKRERMNAPKFRVKDASAIHGKDIILIDDIYTTGSTVYHAAVQLRQYGANSVSSFTLIRA
ncbi:competence protein FC [Parageobacillus genomosp. 1]|uniref:Competence protein FC n=1 Tax=Parageobacillus genomosp. 1 TaxID=1295642 RepID=A0ABC9VAJ6_9BACL|nr:ComF family protein [Parageobacillus genomosp. 1]EZP75135.1 competence protein FC [Parageobacillus genomosp. 1]